MSESLSRTSCLASFVAKAYLVPGSDRVRFDLWKPSLEKRTGIRFETGKMYLLRGTISGVGPFESRHIARANSHVYVFPRSGGAATVRAGAKYSLAIEGIEERRKLDVVAGDRGSYLWISKPVLEGLGIRCEGQSIIELTLRNCRDGAVRRAFAKYRPAMEAVQAFVSAAGYQVGDSIELMGGKEYTIPRFAEDFGCCKEGPTGNVGLEIVGEGVGMRVAGGRVEVARSWLDTRGLNAVLNLEVQPDARRIKFEFDGRRITPRLEDSSAILGFEATSGGLQMTYARTMRERYRSSLGSLQGPEVLEVQGWLAGTAKIVRRPSQIEGIYCLWMENMIRDSVRNRLNGARNSDKRNTIRGDAAEYVTKSLLPDIGFGKVIDHPLPNTERRKGCRRKGPDFLVEDRDTGQWFYVEVKWWQDVTRAVRKAFDEVTGYLRRFPEAKGVVVSGAYIAILDWNITEHAQLMIERVKSNR